MLYFCGAPGQVRHRIIFCGALLASAPQKYIPPIRVFLLVYDGCGEMYFRGGWSQFVEDHDLHQGFFMLFDYHCGTSKFDVKIYECT
jgi:hypothetical protein